MTTSHYAKILQTAVNLIEAETLLQNLDKSLNKILGEFNCDRFAYTFYDDNNPELGRIRHELSSSFLQGWHQHFVRQNYDFIDPVGKKVRQSIVPIRWNLEQQLKYAQGMQKKLFSEALDYGLSEGTSLSLNDKDGGAAIFVLHHSCKIKNLEDRIILEVFVNQLLSYYHNRVITLIKKQNHPHNIYKLEHASKLTRREIECLMLADKNLSAKEIAKIIKISPRTVSFHTENANHKLSAKNKYEAISKAKKLGFL